jgi:outer membrane beta-barrel protein
MKKSGIGLLVAAALCLLPTAGWAQDEAAAEGEAPAEGAAAEGEAPAEGEAAEGDVPVEEGSELAGGGGLEDICKIDPTMCPELDMKKEAARPLREDIYAVQQRFIIKRHRFEFQPYWSITLNDQFVGHPAPGLGINWYITEVLAVGVNGNYYQPFNVDSDFNAQVRRSARVAVPLTEYQWSGALNFTYTPALGKFSGFGDFIFQYDAYVVGGVGALSARPIPVVDPDNRNFEFEPKLAFNAGIGLKVFFNRWFAGVLEVRDYVFNDKLENLTIEADPSDKSLWLDEQRLTNNVQAQLGVSIFLPFSFDYRLPK